MGKRKSILAGGLVLIAILLIIWGLGQSKLLTKDLKMEKITLTTEDNIKIAGLYLPATGTKAIILAHQFGRDKSSWGSLPGELNKAGWSVLAIDLRGHGESDLSYSSFGPADFNKMILDIKTARGFLAGQGKTVSIIGSSIGANLAIMAVGEGLAIRGVALSPGLNFKGLTPEKDAKLITGQDKILLISAEDDSYSYDSVVMLGSIIGPAGKMLNYIGGGHGIDLLASQPELMSKIIDFLNK